ncbi:hypothetical protein [Celeribacter sp.]|uniref:hypothetical protein n=1 Tax=Celeribacter sp. TaxID=1890673 RepID=UPI003A8EC769
MKTLFYALFSLGILICLSPLAAVLWSSFFAARHGCRLDEAGSYPCIVNGHDWGGTLGSAFISGWYLIVTLPMAGLFAAIMLGMFLFGRWRKRRR